MRLNKRYLINLDCCSRIRGSWMQSLMKNFRVVHVSSVTWSRLGPKRAKFFTATSLNASDPFLGIQLLHHTFALPPRNTTRMTQRTLGCITTCIQGSGGGLRRWVTFNSKCLLKLVLNTCIGTAWKRKSGCNNCASPTFHGQDVAHFISEQKCLSTLYDHRQHSQGDPSKTLDECVHSPRLSSNNTSSSCNKQGPT